MTDAPVIHWFRRDLRLTDNTALNAALKSGAPVAAVFILDPAILRSARLGLPRLAFLLDGLRALDADLRKHGGRLMIRRGQPARVLMRLAHELGATALYYNRDVSPYARRRDDRVADALTIPVRAFDDLLLRPPGDVLKQDGRPYAIFTPFKNRWLNLQPIEVAADRSPGTFLSVEDSFAGEMPTLRSLGFPVTVDVPEASAGAAMCRLRAFTNRRLLAYGVGRNALAPHPYGAHPGGTSGISPYLRFGMLSPRQAYHAALDAAERAGHQADVETWVGELIWRDYYAHILHHFPNTLDRYFRPEYEAIAYRTSSAELQAWKDGLTGYPMVDAAMRQLTTLGWMPNRARLIVSAFLTKDLLVDWREGERHFMRWLIDGDPSSNVGNWQWAAGCGADAQPFFRIFNPVGQSQKFDPDGAYIRYWLPELKEVPRHFIHTPWALPSPPKHYPLRIVDHEFARQRALDAYRAMRVRA